jgi:hypothetical protein
MLKIKAQRGKGTGKRVLSFEFLVVSCGAAVRGETRLKKSI